MKVRFVCAILVILILASACASQPMPARQVRKGAREVPAIGHYSLTYITVPSDQPRLIPVTGDKDHKWVLFDICHGRLNSVHPRFGRSLRYPCRNDQP